MIGVKIEPKNLSRQLLCCSGGTGLRCSMDAAIQRSAQAAGGVGVGGRRAHTGQICL